MNVSTGGSHILLFERDQQLAALLSSELQLAGYECHLARTAVEVFDAIARHQVRLVMVNLAQAAAGRREFWVALEAQRRGRGVLVLTYRCTNLAGYGPYDPDEHGQSADIEVDGMIGIMHLVEAVRAQVPLPTTASHPQVRLADLSPQMPLSPSTSSLHHTAPQVAMPPGPGAPGGPGGPPPAPTYLSSAQAAPSAPVPPAMPTHSFTDKIRAVIYPGSRSFATASAPEGVWTGQAGAGQGPQMPPAVGLEGLSPTLPATMATAPTAGLPQMSPRQPPPSPAQAAQAVYQRYQAEGFFQEQGELQQGSPLQQSGYRPAVQEGLTHVPTSASQSYTQYAPPAEKDESSLAQLTRLLHEHSASGPNGGAPPIAERSSGAERRVPPPEAPSGGMPLSTAALRPAPIQGLPQDSDGEYRSARLDPHATGRHPSVTGAAISELSSLRMGAPSTAHPGSAQGSPAPVPVYGVDGLLTEQSSERQLDHRAENGHAHAYMPGAVSERERHVNASGPAGERERVDHADEETAKEMMYAEPVARSAPETPEPRLDELAADTTLLDIVQSLPPMEPAPPPPPVLSGRATRSLGTVLLEGHLVPQDRLEVAQNVQRMLRGVDLNYQLGEILLMFKLLTPDQLLAASLVSYGLLNTAQIRSLGRIRQELHSMGLEYDLENLIILFRILTPEQLREVRASWSS